MPDTAPPAHLDDPTTASLMEAISDARILLGSHEHRQDLAEIAKISNDMIRLEERRVELQASIGKREKVYLDAEQAMGAHLAKKHAFVPVAFAAEAAIARIHAEPDPDPLPNWPNVDPDLLDGSVFETGDKRYVAVNGIWTEEA